MPSSCLGAWSWEILAVEFRNGVVANVVLEYFLGWEIEETGVLVWIEWMHHHKTHKHFRVGTCPNLEYSSRFYWSSLKDLYLLPSWSNSWSSYPAAEYGQSSLWLHEWETVTVFWQTQTLNTMRHLLPFFSNINVIHILCDDQALNIWRTTFLLNTIFVQCFPAPPIEDRLYILG